MSLICFLKNIFAFHMPLQFSSLSVLVLSSSMSVLLIVDVHFVIVMILEIVSRKKRRASFRSKFICLEGFKIVSYAYSFLRSYLH